MGDEPKDEKRGKITGPFGISIDGANGWVLALAVLCAAGLGLWWLSNRSEDERLRIMSAAAVAERDEYGIHIAESPEDDASFMDGHLLVKQFKDGCIAIALSTTRGIKTRLVRSLALEDSAPAHSHNLESLLPSTTLSAAGQCVRGAHPGAPVRTWNEPRNGCWTKVWRQYADGCTLFQMYDDCDRIWSPPQWTTCVH